MNKPTKFMQEILIKISNGYTTQVIDFELCGYKKLKKHDIEISNINNNRRKNIDISVYVWETEPDLAIVNSYIGIKSIDKLKEVLTTVENNYE